MGWLAVRDGSRRGRRLAIIVTLACALAPAAAHGAAAPAVPLGTSVWWACMQAQPVVPVVLRCPRAFDPRYPVLVAQADRPYDVIVPENEMKMPWLEPREGVFDFSVADQLVAYAQQRGMHVRGHTLIFGSTLPGWMTNPARTGNWTRTTLIQALKTYIFTVVGHYRDRFPGVIREWDVVNEAFDDNGSYSRNLLTRVIGTDYVELAFRYAREADPDALLYYNDFNADEPNARQAAILRMAKDFVARGVPLNGIGMQMHLGLVSRVPTPAERVAVMNSYADLGLRVAITELDVGLTPPLGVGQTAAQATVYEQVAQACADQPACSGMTVWGVGDALSWRGLLAASLLYDSQYQPKPALAAVQAILAAAPARAPAVHAASGESLLAAVPVIDTRLRQAGATIAAQGLRVQALCPGTPPCTVELTLSLNGLRLGTRHVAVTGYGHTTRLRMSRTGKRRLLALRRPQTARLRARIGGGPYVAQRVALTVPQSPRAPAKAAARAARAVR
jgi:GH35 family endo-1,4-beta-xylanase